MLTLRLKPKTIFGLILILTGVIVIAVTFFSNHVSKSKNVANVVSLASNEDREAYLTSLGWEYDVNCTEKQVKIPAQFNDTYTRYNEIQIKQGFDLSEYKGKEVTVYTYNIKNFSGFENRDCVFANLLVCDNKLIGGDICSTSASDGFMQGLNKT